MELTAIAAVARNGVIGAQGAIPWHVPEDFRRFKQVTMGGVLIMGRATFESVGPLPGRQIIVITRSGQQLPSTGRDQDRIFDVCAPGQGAMQANVPDLREEGQSNLPTTNTGGGDPDVSYVSSLAEALTLAHGTGKQMFIAGGAQIYRLAWPLLTRLDITEIDSEPKGDAFFPQINDGEWREVSRDPHDGFTFVNYVRR